MTELVPNTPSQATEATNTQRSVLESAERSYGDSYLQDMLKGPGRSPSPAPPPAAAALIASSPSLAALDDIEDPDISRVAESQQSPAAKAEELPVRNRRSGSYSQPPYEVSGNLGETQVQSLGRDFQLAPYRFREEGSRRDSDVSMAMDDSIVEEGDTTAAAAADESRLQEDGDGEQSMDLTRAAGGIQAGEEDVSMDESGALESDAQERVEEVSRTEAEPTSAASLSQKENSHAQPSPSPRRQQSTLLPPPTAPLGPRSSHLNVESGTGPSSSPAVAGHLLQHRLSPQKKALQSLNDHAPSASASTEPASSGDWTGSFLIPPPQAAESDEHSTSRSKSMPEISQDVSGPETSTPAFTGAPLPHPPLTAARTLPEFSRITNPVLPVSTLPIPSTTVARKGAAVYQSSEVLEKIAVKAKKKKRNEWGDTSQETPDGAQQEPEESEEEEEKEGELEGDLPETEAVEQEEEEMQPGSTAPVDEDGEQSMSLDRTIGQGEQTDSRAATPKPTASGDARAPAPFEEVKEEQESLATSDAPSAPPAHQPSQSANSSSRVSSSARLQPHGSLETPQFGPNIGISQSQSQSQSQNQSINGDLEESLSSAPRMNLTDIGGLLSSQAGGSQIDVEPTQIDYDVEQLPPVNGDLSVGSSTRQLPAFVIDTAGSNNTSINSVPRPGRELRRIPPPPSPVHPTVVGAALPETQQSSSPGIPLAPTAIATVVSSGSLQPTAQRTSSPAPADDSAPSKFASSPSQGVAAPSPSLHLSAEHQQPITTSSNGVVPDSEGPTQDSPPVARREERRPSPAPVAQHSVDDSMDVDQATDRPQHQQLEQHGLEPMEESVEQPLVRVLAAKKGAQKAVANKAKTPAPARDKGKGRAVQPPPESPDELDLFQPTQPPRQPAAARPAPRVESHEVEEMETNYDDPPGARNSKRVSPKKSVRPAVSSPVASSSSPAASPARGRKRKLSSVVPVVEIDVPVKRAKDQPAKGKSALKAKAPARAKAKATKTGGVKEGAATKTRKAPPAAAVSSSGGQRTASPEEEEEEEDRGEEEQEGAPIAGPSRLRFDSVDEVMPDVSVASSERGDSKSSNLGLKIKLPASAPFTRCFGLWRDNGWLYPGTITAVTGKQFKVVFDDLSSGKLNFSEIRRCELRQGDYIRYRGTEIDTETQAATLEQDLRVYRGERAGSGEDVVGALQKADVLVATPLNMPLEQQAEACRSDRGVQRLQVEGIAIGPQHRAQLDDRKLTPAEEVAFLGRPDKKAIKPLALVTITAPPTPAAITANKKVGLLSRVAFLITSTKGDEAEKNAFLARLREHGATVIELGHLFDTRIGAKGGDSVLEFSSNPTFKNLDTILLIAERPSTTTKYLVALALGIPCISPRFVDSSIEKGIKLDWKDFALTSGFLQSLNAHAIGAQMRSISKPTFNLDSLSTLHGRGGIFSGLAVLVVAKKGKTQTDYARNLLLILAAAGATKIHFVATAESAGSAAGYDHVILEDSVKKTSSLSTHPGVSNLTWLKQCLIAGRRLPSAVMKAVEE